MFSLYYGIFSFALNWKKTNVLSKVELIQMQGVF